MNRIFYLPLSILFFFSGNLFAQALADAEAGLVMPTYNDIRIPGDGGTLFDANEQLSTGLKVYYRFRAGYRFGDRHNVFLLFAPLQLTYTGAFRQPIAYMGSTFGPEEPTTLTYVFNSYRLTYRYDFIESDRIRAGAGLTAKIRDAYIDVAQEGLSARKSNVGFVPLINLYFNWRFAERFGLLVEGDGLASPQGRAFDFEVALPFQVTDQLTARIGYRFLEGGADNDEVYNFTLLQYGLGALSLRF
ncbi:hypothetical protein SAMN05421823_107202 [Catalinimonas alkaloidigena]|uniref:Outer membrane protein beta-barrel domain-containing protein n=1 Tax=Catalinimonas alkaloidigena TaxID=1075417 RepID=A0A1G9LXT9_9BACT|nr:hypothetical protein [Catalinimonas alkaloidigena]SDL66799.1 hypothetical protein SAMN05421823_107202 [Catalinimonas alkaloidigena]